MDEGGICVIYRWEVLFVYFFFSAFKFFCFPHQGFPLLHGFHKKLRKLQVNKSFSEGIFDEMEKLWLNINHLALVEKINHLKKTKMKGVCTCRFTLVVRVICRCILVTGVLQFFWLEASEVSIV